MTSSGKIRIYELSRDLHLDNKEVLDAAKKLSISAKSHSSSISDEDAKKIKTLLLSKSNKKDDSSKTKQKSNKEILTLKKAVKSSLKGSIANDHQDRNLKSKTDKNNKSSIDLPKKTIAKSPSRPTTLKVSKDKKPSPLSENKPSLSSPKPPISPAPQTQKVQAPIPRNSAIDTNNIKTKQPKAKPKIIGKPKSASQINSNELIKKPLTPTHINQSKKIERPNPQVPQRPIAPPPRPKVQKVQPISTQQTRTSKPSLPISNQRTNIPQRNSSGEKRGNKPAINLPNKPTPGQPPSKGNRVELVGAPIRRNNKKAPTNPIRRGSKDRDFRPGVSKQNHPSNRPVGQRKPEGVDRSPKMRPRPGMPLGMRKPVSPGELMQLQKPSNNVTPPIKRNEISKGGKRDSSTPTPKPPSNRPTPSTAPKRPPSRAGAASSARKRKPDWDDAAKLEALRNKSPQKQRQKVHIIGENDDALTTETSGFAGGQQAILVSASLARPSTPKSKASKSGASKPTGAIRKRKKESTRQRQRRRAMELRAAREAKQVRPEMIIVPEENITVQELADKLSVESSEIIKSLFFKGITATVTQSLDLQTIETVAEEFGVPVLQDDAEEAAKKTVEMIEETDLKHLIRRPPVVTVMGHVDHGKTSLLDAIRKSRVAAGEAGGITQHIGAYQVEVNHDKKLRKLTFLDTPGHEAFTAMRARGTKVTDVAVLVVAADDGVRPQTLEAISHARAAKVPIVVAINKIDKEGASPDRVKKELSEQELVAEDWGGDVVMMPVSAIKGENIDKLLEMILLVTEVEDLQANPDRLAKGTVVEAHLDKAKGPVATLLVQNGTLRSGNVLAAGPVLGKVRAMVDENGKRLKEAGPSCPVEALGFSEVPTAGDEFEVYPDEKSARSVVGERASDARATRLAQQMASRRVSLASISSEANDGDLKELNLILKADVQGSVEAILGSLEQLPKDEVQVRVLLSAPGEITETDVDLAAASGAVIIGFNTSMASGAKRAADANSVDVREYEVIYKLLEDIQLAMEGLLEPDLVEEKTGEAEVRAIFTIGKSAVAGCYITSGKLQRNCKVRVKRSGEIVFEGDLDSLRRNKDVVKDVSSGFECGIGCDRFANWKEGDLIEGYKLVTQRRKLTT